MKTPEEMYYEWRQTFDKSLYDGMCKGETITHQLLHQDLGKETFLAGYKAAHEQALNIISKIDNATDRMLQKATCFPAAQPQWISVKDRLPSCGVLCAWISDTTQSCIERIEVDDMHPWYEGFDYWCELPEAPKEEKE